MTIYETLPPHVLTKIAQIEGHCLTLTSALERARRDLLSLRVEQRDLAPRTVGDEWEANREFERLASEGQRLRDAITVQAATCERLERQLRAEERIVASCKRFLHDLPAGARLRVVEAQAGDLDEVRLAIKQVKDEISRVQALPVPSDDLADRVRRHVDELAAKARPIIAGIGDGQALRVLYPLTGNADRVTLSGFVADEANALLLMALVDGERLAERLLQVALEGSISATERNERLQALRLEETRLRYDEETAICVAISNGDDGASRSGSAPAWAVLQVQVESELDVAA